jgi:alkyldihydroxyacetonephosphate synthase
LGRGSIHDGSVMQIRDVPKRSFRSIFKWGAPDVFYDVDDRLRGFIRETLQLPEERFSELFHPGLEEVPDLPAPGLPGTTLARLEDIVGPGNVATDGYTRTEHCCGSTYLDLLRLRLGQVESAPDAVVYPRTEDDVSAVVALCHEHTIALVPAGARSSVSRGLESPRGGVCLDMTRHLNQVLELNETNHTARVQAGMVGPAYEEWLNRRGYTCGHFPQSFEFSTVGGWLAARGAGQQSTHYGKIEDMVLGLRCAAPRGMLATTPFPRAALGPDFNQMIVGSEGTLGVITEATLKVWPHRPKSVLPLTFMFRSFEDGVKTIRTLLQGGIGRPGVCRLSDPEETEIAFTLDGLAGGGIDRTLQRLGYRPGSRSLMIAATEGDFATATATAARAHAIAIKQSGLPLGSKPLRAWWKRRFHDPYLRDDLMDYGVMTDTLETAMTWSDLPQVWRGVREVIKARPHTACLTHISHAYETGANLYFIVLGAMNREHPKDDYQDFHRKIIDAVVTHGGSLSHHHGVGRLFAPWYPQHVGEVAVEAYRGLKSALDPRGIMNPGAYGLGME